MQIYCPNCGKVLDDTLDYPIDNGWCDKCKTVFDGPPRPIQGWVLGVVLFLGQATFFIA